MSGSPSGGHPKAYTGLLEAIDSCRAAGVPARVIATVTLGQRRLLVTVTGPARPDEVALRPGPGSLGVPLREIVVSRTPAQIGPDTWDFELVHRELEVRFFLELGTAANVIRLEFRVLEGHLDGQEWPPTIEGETPELLRIADLEAALSALRHR